MPMQNALSAPAVRFDWPGKQEYRGMGGEDEAGGVRRGTVVHPLRARERKAFSLNTRHPFTRSLEERAAGMLGAKSPTGVCLAELDLE